MTLLDPPGHNRRITTATRANETLNRILTILDARLRTIHDAQPGWPRVQNYGGPQAPGRPATIGEHDNPTSPISDPTGETASHNAMNGDIASIAIKRIDNHLATLDRVVQAIEADLVSWAPRQPTMWERRNVNASEPSCESCVRLVVAGISRWEPIHRGREIDGRTWLLCTWCWGFHRDTGTLPTREQLATHHSGKRVMRRA